VRVVVSSARELSWRKAFLYALLLVILTTPWAVIGALLGFIGLLTMLLSIEVDVDVRPERKDIDIDVLSWSQLLWGFVYAALGALLALASFATIFFKILSRVIAETVSGVE